ncbi:MAG: serine hydrolase [Synechococcus sp.]
MGFYRQDPALEAWLQAAVGRICQERGGWGGAISVICLISEGDPQGGAGSGWRGASLEGDRCRYPASVIKLFYLAATEAWLAQDLLIDGPELRRALADMIRDSGNDATSYVVDLLTGTRSGPELPPEAFHRWSEQRLVVNRWFEALGWPEWQGCNACQKTWAEGPYGRERQSYGAALENRNRLTTAMTARLLQAVMAGEWVSPQASTRMRDLLARSLDPAERQADPENQVDGFLGQGLPTGSRLWSKAGWMSQARHDAAFCEVPGLPPFLLVAFGEGAGPATDESWLPGLCRELVESLKAPVSA